MATAVFPTPFQTGFRLIDGNQLNSVLSTPLLSSQDGITAHAGGGQTNATQLTAVINRVTVAVSGADSVKLPAFQVGLEITIENDAANAVQVFSREVATINGSPAATGVSQPAGTYATYRCTTAGQWRVSPAAAGTFGAITVTSLNGNTVTTGTGVISPTYIGTVTLNGTTPVPVVNTNVTANSIIVFTFKTLGGTLGAYPVVSVKTAAGGFSVLGTALDTSVYNYAIFG